VEKTHDTNYGWNNTGKTNFLPVERAAQKRVRMLRHYTKMRFEQVGSERRENIITKKEYETDEIYNWKENLFTSSEGFITAGPNHNGGVEFRNGEPEHEKKKKQRRG